MQNVSFKCTRETTSPRVKGDDNSEFAFTSFQLQEARNKGFRELDNKGKNYISGQALDLSDSLVE